MNVYCHISVLKIFENEEKWLINVSEEASTYGLELAT